MHEAKANIERDLRKTVAVVDPYCCVMQLWSTRNAQWELSLHSVLFLLFCALQDDVHVIKTPITLQPTGHVRTRIGMCSGRTITTVLVAIQISEAASAQRRRSISSRNCNARDIEGAVDNMI